MTAQRQHRLVPDPSTWTLVRWLGVALIAAGSAGQLLAWLGWPW